MKYYALLNISTSQIYLFQNYKVLNSYSRKRCTKEEYHIVCSDTILNTYSSNLIKVTRQNGAFVLTYLSPTEAPVVSIKKPTAEQKGELNVS